MPDFNHQPPLSALESVSRETLSSALLHQKTKNLRNVSRETFNQQEIDQKCFT